jgi:hypothetical protein
MESMKTYRDPIHWIFVGLSLLTATAVLGAGSADGPAPSGTTAPSNQIWECTTNGLRTFSNNPCGQKSAVRQLNPINVMDPSPTIHVARSYAPGPAVQPEYSYPEAQEPIDSSYGGTDGVILVRRVHREHPHVVHGHPRGRAAK